MSNYYIKVNSSSKEALVYRNNKIVRKLAKGKELEILKDVIEKNKLGYWPKYGNATFNNRVDIIISLYEIRRDKMLKKNNNKNATTKKFNDKDIEKLATNKKKKLTGKKVNRKKSKVIVPQKVAIAVVMGAIIGVGGVKLSNNNENKRKEPTDISYEEVKNSDDVDVITYDDGDMYDYKGEVENDTNSNYLEFDYYSDSDKKISNNDIENTLRYKDIFDKYGHEFGIDSNLLIALATNESSGIHDIDYDNPDIGIMQIEWSVWLNKKVKAYNYEKNEFDSLIITNDVIESLEGNIKAGTMILQENINKTVRYGYDDKLINASDILSYSLQRYNMGVGNMQKLLRMGGDWKDNRNEITAGDSKYFEHVLAYLKLLDNGEDIKINSFDEDTKEIKEWNFEVYDTNKAKTR
mgnify:FL=1